MRRVDVVRLMKLLSLGCLAVVVMGCGGNAGPKIAPVRGHVTSQGQPVGSGTVNFASDSGFGAMAELDADGQYRLVSQYGPGIPLGTYKVTVTPRQAALGEGETSPPPPDDPKIPRKYRDFATTDLTAEVKEGSNDFSFDLKP